MITVSDIILSIILGIIGYYLLRFQRRRQMLNKIPGPKSLYILGNVMDFYVEKQHLLLAMGNMWKEFYDKRILRTWMGPAGFAVVFKAESVETILTSHKHIDKSREYDFLHKWLGTGLLTATGSKWRSRRKTLTPAFHFKILEDFIDIINKESKKLILKLSHIVKGESFDLFPYITYCALDIIHETALGVSINAQDRSDSEYVKAVYEIVAIIHQRQMFPWYQNDFIYSFTNMYSREKECLRILHGHSNNVIRKRRQELATKNLRNSKDDDLGRKEKLVFLDLLLTYTDNGKVLSDEDIREEVDTFMFEGHDTTSAAISFCIYLLGLNPEKQKLLHEELDSIFGDDDRPATAEDLKNLKYLECCIKEALRIFPSVPMFTRQIHEDLVLENYTVPSGTTITIPVYFLHRDPENFPDPEEFMPERFEAAETLKRHPFAYAPFSAGPRNCIGQKFAMMEEKIIISSVFRKFTAKSPIERQNMEICAEIVLRPLRGLQMVLEPR